MVATTKVFEKKVIRENANKKDLRKGFVLKREKVYLLSRIERKKVQEFIKDQLKKRYIRPLK